MKWVTRARPQVDRIACPWLIKRFVDPDAEFLYVPGDQIVAVAEREGAPESRGLLAIAQGFSAAYHDDLEQLADEMPVYDALYAWCANRRTRASVSTSDA